MLIAQDSVANPDKSYGLDQKLCNGKKYIYSPPPGTLEHQYLASREFMDGSVTIHGKTYDEINLNYDIFNQQLLLKYESDSGGTKILEVSKAWLTAFRIGTRNFEYLNLEDNPRFFQVLGEGPVRILYFWRKNLGLDVTIENSRYIFGSAVRESYVLLNGRLETFSTRRSLISLFDRKLRPEIKSYMRKNKIRMRRSSDQEMAKMITYIGTLK